jgi:hypothetical protein
VTFLEALLATIRALDVGRGRTIRPRQETIGQGLNALSVANGLFLA